MVEGVSNEREKEVQGKLEAAGLRRRMSARQAQQFDERVTSMPLARQAEDLSIPHTDAR